MNKYVRLRFENSDQPIEKRRDHNLDISSGKTYNSKTDQEIHTEVKLRFAKTSDKNAKKSSKQANEKDFKKKIKITPREKM